MKQRRSLAKKIIPWVIVILLLAAFAYVLYLVYSHTDDTDYGTPEVVMSEGDSGKVTMENDFLLFDMDRATTQFSITDKKTGKVWYSNPVDRDKDPIAMGTNKDWLSSTLNITYTFSGGENELNNYTYSMQNQSYELIQQEDGSVRINYAIGKIERTYILPVAITVERYKQFTEAMSSKNKKQVSSSYTLVEPDKLDKKDNKEELLTLYPSVEHEALYILKSDIKSSNKEKIEGIFQAAGYTQEDFELDQQNVAGDRSNNGPVFNVSVIYRLDGNDLVVEVPYSEIKCESGTPMTYVSILPVFGAAGTEREGFIMLPEGGGALMRYNNGKLSQSPYYANLYGWDYATERTEVVSETRNAFPVFGMGQEDGSFICIIEGGSAYAGINADISGRFNSYNFVYSKYNVLHYDRFNVSNRTAQLLYMYEKQIPQDTLVQRYVFLEGDSYVDMANAYGDYLRRNPDMNQEQASEDIPINVELIGAINKIVPKAGLPIDSVIPTTTFSESESIMNELLDSGIRNLHLRITGWCNGGVRQKVLTGIHVQGELGGDSGMKKLIAAAREKDVPLAFDGISCFAYDSGITDGFTPFSNAARFTTREQVKLYNYDTVTYQQSDWQDPYYLVRPDFAKKCTDNLIAGLADRGAAGVAFRDLGNLLSADYYNQNTVTREQVKAMNIQSLKEAREKGLAVTIKEGNDYAIPYADLITDMNLTGNAYAIIDQRIPFYQIAIHGMKNYTGEAVNLAGDYQTVLLECAEYGAGLSFSFMNADTTVVRDSIFSCYTASGYERWKKDAVTMINRYQSEMAGLNRMKITGHENLTQNVSRTVYEDGTEVYVNYGESEYNTGSVTVPARDYLVRKGGK